MDACGYRNIVYILHKIIYVQAFGLLTQSRAASSIYPEGMQLLCGGARQTINSAKTGIKCRNENA